jgi:1,4-alpha-glucan branching enzyme
VKTAVASYKHLFGKAPTSFWLPGYGYRPEQVTETGRQRPGLETALAANGFTSFLVDSHAFTGRAPRSVAAGDVIGVYGAVKKRYVLPVSARFPEARREVSPFAPQMAASGGDDAQNAGIAVIARNERVGQQVWGNELGYPMDFDYREANRRAGTSGLRYWRVTGQKVDPHNKDYYHPDWAAYKIEQHAEHFAHLVGDQLRSYNNVTGAYGLVMASFDADLFGRGWYEGIQWLGYALRHLAGSPDIDLTTVTPFVAAHPPTGTVAPLESSWGLGGLHFLWDNQDTHWMWSALHDAEDRMERLADHFAAPNDAERVVLAQAARELLLMQSSDWPFLVTSGDARMYAIRRFGEHANRFDQLAASLEAGTPDVDAAQRWWKQDNVFADVDYRWFANKSTEY